MDTADAREITAYEAGNAAAAGVNAQLFLEELKDARAELEREVAKKLLALAGSYRCVVGSNGRLIHELTPRAKPLSVEQAAALQAERMMDDWMACFDRWALQELQADAEGRG